eukprot:GGOE01037774.1.p1 GENE.GGOE01037774.1~~GGOE01037774.1.p1  ORF type:complete len:352 (+),score=53.72 GGOE01037774.1:56-1111(+)
MDEFHFSEDLFEFGEEAESGQESCTGEGEQPWKSAIGLLEDRLDRLQCGRGAAVIASMATDRNLGDPLRTAGAIQLLTALLLWQGRPVARDDPEDVLNCAAMTTAALRNLACANHANREAVRAAGAIPLLVTSLRLADVQDRTPEDSASIACHNCVTAACGALRNLSHSNIANCIAIREAGGLIALARHVPHPPPPAGTPGREAAFRASSALCNLCCGCPDNVAALWETGLVPRLVALLAQPGGSGFWHTGFTSIVEYGQENGWLPQDLREERWAERRSAEKNSRRAIRRLQFCQFGGLDRMTEQAMDHDDGVVDGKSWDPQAQAWRPHAGNTRLEVDAARTDGPGMYVCS